MITVKVYSTMAVLRMDTIVAKAAFTMVRIVLLVVYF